MAGRLRGVAFALIVLAARSLPVSAGSVTCNATAPRTDCGYPTITQQQCVAKGCCWEPVSPNPNNEPWCIYSSGGPNPPPPPKPQPKNCKPSTPYRFDCGYDGINSEECNAKGCCWNPVNPNPNNEPWCYFADVTFAKYSVTSRTTTATGYTGTIAVQGNSNTSTPYGAPISPLAFLVEVQTDSRLRVKIYDPNNARWEPPAPIVAMPESGSTMPANPQLTIDIADVGQPFNFAVTRIADSETIFNTKVDSTDPATGFVFTDKYLSLVSELPATPLIYGIGEHNDPLLRPVGKAGHQHLYTLWNRDSPTPVDQNIYGSHPFYLELRNGKAHGVYLRNSNGMDIGLESGLVQYHVIGGVLDFYFIDGPTPEQVTQNYHNAIGLPALPPYWSLGWHQCRYGFKDLAAVQTCVDDYRKAGIPLETIWNDIDYMDKYLDFTWDPVNYPQNEVAAFAAQLHSSDQHYVTIVDPGIHNQDGYPAWEDGLEAGIFIETDGKPYIGDVWPGSTAFPDFLNPAATTYWTNQIKTFHAGVPVDGLWIDMNEISNFESGGNDGDPTYNINNCGGKCPLDTKTLPMNAVHHDGVLEYDAHNLYGLTEAIATRAALESITKKRSFVLSRSTFAGSGSHTAHWLGDNFSTFQSMASSIPGILNFNIYGVPLVGADTCGFIGSTTEELCARWTALGAFSPFSRNHDNKGDPDQFPYLWPSVTQVAKQTIAAKYSLLPYYYTLMAQAAKQGGTVARPLFFEFPTDSNTFAVDTQLLIGPSLMITPVLTQGATSVTAYFPPTEEDGSHAMWYDWWTKAPFTKTGSVSVSAPMTYIPVYLRGGGIVPTQAPEMTTTATRMNALELLVIPNAAGGATGSLFWDDGETLDWKTQSTVVSWEAANGKLKSTVTQTTGPALDYGTISVLGQEGSHTCTVNGASAACSVDSSGVLSITVPSGLSVTGVLTATW